MTEVSLLSEHNQNSKSIKQFYNCVYLIHNIKNNKVYIGQACNLWERFRVHIYNSKKEKGHLYRSIRKHGKENFKLYVLDTDIKYEYLDTVETAFIQLYKSYKRKYGYNILPMASIAKGYTFEKKEKERIYQNMFRKICQIDPNTLEVINVFNSIAEAEIFLGVKKYGSGINSCCRGRLHTSCGFKWKYFEEDLVLKQDGRKRPLTEETKRKLSESHTGKKYGTTKRVYQIDKNTLEIIKEYSSLSEAAKETSINVSAICNSCKNIVRTAGKFIWKYADSELIFKSKTESKSMKKVIQIDVNTKQIINTFDSITEASASAKVSDCTVRRHCQNQVKNPEIFTWKYYTDLQ